MSRSGRAASRSTSGSSGTPPVPRGPAAAFAATLRVFFVEDAAPPTCTVTPGARSCPAGGHLEGRAGATRDGFALATHLTGALPDAFGLTFLSPDGMTSPIQGLRGCVFFQTPVLHEAFRTDANGDAQTLIRFPARVGGSFSLQQASLLIAPRGIVLATSNTLDVACN